MTTPSLQVSFTSAQTLTWSAPSLSSPASIILDIELSNSFVAQRPIDTIGLAEDILGIYCGLAERKSWEPEIKCSRPTS